MLNKLKKTKQEGFTIIEVMIVLAIAGLIILIVLLAIPALQRNGRNTAIKNDASALAAAISEYKSNNDGQYPTTGTQNGGTYTLSGGGANADAKVQGNTTVCPITSSIGQWCNNYPPDSGSISIFPGYKCTSSNAWVSTSRSVIIIYAVETAGNPQVKCLDA